MNQDELRARIESTLTILAALRTAEPHALRRALALAAETLKQALGGLTEVDRELEVVTAPDRSAAADVVRLTKELDAARGKITRLEQDLAMARSDLDVEKNVQAEERKRLAQLEKKHKEYEALLLNDPKAFSDYFDRALEVDEKKRGRRPPQR